MMKNERNGDESCYGPELILLLFLHVGPFIFKRLLILESGLSFYLLTCSLRPLSCINRRLLVSPGRLTTSSCPINHSFVITNGQLLITFLWLTFSNLLLVSQFTASFWKRRSTFLSSFSSMDASDNWRTTAHGTLGGTNY